MGAPPAATPPLEQHETNKPEYPNPFKYRDLALDPNDILVGGRRRKRPTIFEHEIRDNIDKVMKENYDYEQ